MEIRSPSPESGDSEFLKKFKQLASLEVWEAGNKKLGKPWEGLKVFIEVGGQPDSTVNQAQIYM